jgi:glucuronyl esterase-like protein
MNLRRLALMTFAAPLLLVACSSDDGEGTVPPFGGQPSPTGNPSQQPAPTDTNTPGTPPAGTAGAPGNGDQDLGNGTPLDPGQMPDNGNGAGNGAGGTGTVDPGVTGVTPIGEVENRGADCVVPELPAGNTLPDSTQLPDPFTKLDGTRMTTKAEWICRREEILRQSFQYIYGQKPAKPESVTGTVSNTQVAVNVSNNGQNANFSATITTPGGAGPFPAVISFSGSGPVNQIAAQGVAVINFNQGSIGNRTTGAVPTLYGSTTAGDLAVWAWGVSRIIDVLQASDNTVIDSTKLAVTGCSFLGKAAFAAGALDERIALVIPLESGIGGVPSYKIVPQLQPNPTNSGTGPEQPQHAINNGWLPAGSLVGQFNKLPVDTHEILGLVAPRGLLVLGNTGGNGQFYLNLDNTSEHATVLAGKEIFSALGMEDRLSYDSRNVTHCNNTDMFTAAVQASVGRFLLGNGATTGTVTTDWEGVRVSPDQFIDWETPTLAGELP